MSQRSHGIACATGAYLLWGVLPVYWKLLQAVPALQILAHRIIWSFVFLTGLILLRREWPSLREASKKPRTLGLYAIAAVLLSVNWGTYIWAVNANQIVETSLGYFVNPLVSVLLAVAFLKERLRRGQWMAVGLAAVGVGQLTLHYGRLPWIALVLAGTFALYGLAKKLSPLAALPGLGIETAMLVPIAFAFVVQLEFQGRSAFGHASWTTTFLLGLAGIVTALPLLLFARAALTVHLSTLGLLQYMAPSCGLLLGVLVYGEPFPRERAIGFGLIWLALAVYWWEGFSVMRRAGLRQVGGGTSPRPAPGRGSVEGGPG